MNTKIGRKFPMLVKSLYRTFTIKTNLGRNIGHVLQNKILRSSKLKIKFEKNTPVNISLLIKYLYVFRTSSELKN